MTRIMDYEYERILPKIHSLILLFYNAELKKTLFLMQIRVNFMFQIGLTQYNVPHICNQVEINILIYNITHFL